MQSRYIVWQDTDRGGCCVREVLGTYPGVSVLRSSSPDQAVVIMDDVTERRLRREHPGLSVEPDVQHRLAGRW